MSVPSAPADRRVTRFKLPIEAPLNTLLIASLTVIAAGCQLFAWALARLPIFFMWFGLLLFAIGLGIALAVLIRRRLLSWIAFVGPESLTILRGGRRKVHTWDTVGAVVLQGFRIRVMGPARDSTLSTLMVDRTREAHDAARAVVEAAQKQLRSRS